MKTKELKFTVTDAEKLVIRFIVKRAIKLGKEWSLPVDPMDIEMDLRATNANGCPLDFDKLLTAPNGDFGHDVWGIRRHLNRETGKLGDFFLPRCSKPSAIDSEGRVKSLAVA